MLQLDVLLGPDRRPERKRRAHRVLQRDDAGLRHPHRQRASEPFRRRRQPRHPVYPETALLTGEQILPIRCPADGDIGVGGHLVGYACRLQGRSAIIIVSLSPRPPTPASPPTP